MTSLLMHTVAHSTRPSFRLKPNDQPLKKFLSLVVSRVKVVKNCKILTFKVKYYPNLPNFFFSLKNIILGSYFWYWHFLKTLKFKALYFLKSCPFFVNWIYIFGKRYENVLRVIFDQLPKLYSGFDAEPEIRILKVI